MIAGSVHVIRPGLRTIVQDEGRWGSQARGVPVAGPMDPFSQRLANALVGNARTAATLEIALAGPELEFDDERVVAVTGAVFSLAAGGRSVPHGHPFLVAPQTRLLFGARGAGARAYLAVEGGFDVPLVLGSRATHAPSGMGGWKGRALARGDRIPLGSVNRSRRAGRRPRAAEPSADPHLVRVLPGPDLDRFADDALEELQADSYVVASDSDRIGYRLIGRPLRHTRGADIISDATPLGSIQVPASGHPVLLMADGPTTGGYPRIATVIRADVGVAGQASPGDALSFRVCTPAEALAALIANEQRLLAVEMDLL
jgi:antagonist of KipI